jgi:hypothetical protein
MTGPWRLADTIRRAQAYLVAAVALSVAWYGSASSTVPNTQLLFVAAGIGSVVLVGGAEVFWLTAGLHAVRDRRAALPAALYALICAEVPSISTSRELVSVPTGTLYHASDCLAVRGKQTTAATVARHARAGRSACRLCQP